MKPHSEVPTGTCGTGILTTSKSIEVKVRAVVSAFLSHGYPEKVPGVICVLANSSTAIQFYSSPVLDYFIWLLYSKGLYYLSLHLIMSKDIARYLQRERSTKVSYVSLGPDDVPYITVCPIPSLK